MSSVNDNILILNPKDPCEMVLEFFRTNVAYGKMTYYGPEDGDDEVGFTYSEFHSRADGSRHSVSRRKAPNGVKADIWLFLHKAKKRAGSKLVRFSPQLADVEQMYAVIVAICCTSKASWGIAA